MKHNLPTVVGQGLFLWASLSIGAHLVFDEPLFVPMALAATELPKCSSEEVRSTVDRQLNERSTQSLKVQTSAVPNEPEREDTRLCVAVVTGPLAQIETIFLLQWNKANPGYWVVDLGL